MQKYVTQSCTDSDKEYIVGKLTEYNLSHVPPTQDFHFLDLSRKIIHQNGETVAGVIATLNGWGCPHIDMLWVAEGHRKAGLGAFILADIEAEAKQRGCYLVHLDTFDFQAKGFYIKQGYEVFGVMDDCPQGHQRYFLKKMLG